MRKLSLLFILFCLFSCRNIRQAQTGKKINLEISKEIELLTVIQLMSNYPLLSKTETDLKTKTETFFKPYQQDPVILHFLSMASKTIEGKTKFSYFSFDKPIDIIMHYSLSKEKIITNPTQDNASYSIYTQKKDSLQMFLELYQDFYKKSSFESYFASNAVIYQALIDLVETAINEEYLIETIESFYGETRQSYNVILSPLQNAGGYSIKMDDTLYAVVGAGLVKDSMPHFDIECLKKELILHEFSHSFCNPIVDNHINELNFMENSEEGFRFKMASLGYHNNKSILYEYFVRACVIRMVNTLYGTVESENLLNEEVKKGFYLMPAFDRSLKEYKNSRELYPTLELYMPKLISQIKTAANDELRNRHTVYNK
ncbi:MAG: DUF4932 domain-containing protein [Bacteroidetes bacterium]|nr:DUF4932 domain-containing protein [Bacteroidota bacterium]